MILFDLNIDGLVRGGGGGGERGKALGVGAVNCLKNPTKFWGY